MKNQRYRQRGNIEVDLQFMAWMMDDLQTNTGIEKGNWITSKKIKEVTSNMQSNEKTANTRIYKLVQSGFLIKKKMPKAEKKRRYGTVWRTDCIYTFGSSARLYLQQYSSFLNPDGWLMKKGMKESRQLQPQESKPKQPQDQYIGVLE